MRLGRLLGNLWRAQAVMKPETGRRSANLPTFENRKYGFVLNQGAGAASGVRYLLQIAGRSLIISDRYYVEITTPDRKIFLASGHNAAVLFTKREQLEGRLCGDEQWVHIDNKLHPDNRPLAAEVEMSPQVGLREIERLLDIKAIKASLLGGIGVSNFMTAVAKQSPRMEFHFLHDGGTPPKAAEDWFGMKYSQVSSLLESDLGSAPEQGRVTSWDLDLLGCYEKRGEGADQLVEKALPIARSSKLVMIFVSPGYLGLESARKWLERIVPGLL